MTGTAGAEASQTRPEALRAALLAGFDLGPHELVLVEEACRTLATCDELALVLELEGLVVAGQAGVPKVHPALVELRHQRTTLARLLVALRVPDLDELGAGARGQRRGIRGVHQ